MGADFLFNYFDWKAGKTAKQDKANFRKALDQVRARILKINKNTDPAMLEELVGDLRDNGDDGGGDPLVLPRDVKAAQEVLLEALSVVRKAWEEEGRCTASIKLGGRRAMVTGGDSWGDAPNDVWEAIDKLQRAGVLR